MTGQQFETKLCDILSQYGWWCLNIPRSRGGAQPFDIIAIKKINGNNVVFAIDCKVCSTDRLPLERIEDNQWLAFEDITSKTDCNAVIAAYYDGDIWIIFYDDLRRLRDSGAKGTKVTSWYKMNWLRSAGRI